MTRTQQCLRRNQRIELNANKTRVLDRMECEGIGEVVDNLSFYLYYRGTITAK